MLQMNTQTEACVHQVHGRLIIGIESADGRLRGRPARRGCRANRGRRHHGWPVRDWRRDGGGAARQPVPHGRRELQCGPEQARPLRLGGMCAGRAPASAPTATPWRRAPTASYRGRAPARATQPAELLDAADAGDLECVLALVAAAVPLDVPVLDGKRLLRSLSPGRHHGHLAVWPRSCWRRAQTCGGQDAGQRHLHIGCSGGGVSCRGAGAASS